MERWVTGRPGGACAPRRMARAWRVRARCSTLPASVVRSGGGGVSGIESAEPPDRPMVSQLFRGF
jgi:hypothetical protein